MTRSPVLLIALAAASMTILVGCGASGGSGPLRNLPAGNQGPAVGGGAIPVLPGQFADFTVNVVNPSGAEVRITSVSIIPAPHYPVAVLAHAGVVMGKGFVAAGRGWPDGMPVKPFAGEVLKPGQSNIMIGVTGAATGRDYAVAGIRIDYTADGTSDYLDAWSVGLACVRSKIGPDYPGCSATLTAVIQDVQEKLVN